MRVTLLASADFAIPVLEALVASGHEVALGTQPARPAGRGQKPRPTPVAARALELGLPAHELADVNSPAGLDWLRTTHPDLVAVVAFGQKLGPAVRAAGPWGCLNIHPSLLPRWRGAAPVPAALLEGDEETGVCIIDVVDRMDAGAVLAQRRTPTRGKTAGELLDELAHAGARLLLDVLDGLARGDVQRVPQDETRVTRARKLVPDDGRIRWEHEAARVDARVRAVTPRPGAFTLLPDGTRVAILRGEPVPAERGHLPGEVLARDDGLVVACGRDALRIARLQREGKRPLDAEEFLRGHPLPPGTRFGP
ncbi:MAG TPA: methionyl-tRNA formyltransferase [Planctomycetota bacterium]|nr:methionyl-tRNA formyltransferase [Planctomycetota bacterium]